MTRTRYALVVASAVLFALAFGVALGGGPLRQPVGGAMETQAEAADAADEPADARLVRHNRELTGSVRFGDAFADAVSGELLGDRLAGRTAAVIALPGVRPQVVDGVAADIQAAGGSVTSTLRVGGDLVDPAARPLVDELADRLLADLDDTKARPGASAYTRLGALTARALLTEKNAGEAVDAPARSVFNTLRTARLLRGDRPSRRAGAAVVLLPESPRRPAVAGGQDTIVTDLTAALDDASDGVVVAGPRSSARRSGLLADVRRSAATRHTVSTVDNVQVRAGRLVTVLALAEQVRGEGGDYGLGRGARTVLP